jgi:hypothetical protein
MSKELINKLTSYLNIIVSFDNKSIDELKKISNTYNIGVYYKPPSDDRSTDQDKRICLRSNTTNFNMAINGIVISSPQGILVKPPKRLHHIELSNTDFFKKVNYKHYEMIEAATGTMLSLYYFQGQWYLSSSRSVDVNVLCINSKEPLMSIFMKLAKKQNLDINKLNVNYSYTFIICYQELHILPINRLYFVIAYDRKTDYYINIPELEHMQQTNLTSVKPDGISWKDFIIDKCSTATQRLVEHNDLFAVNGIIMRSKNSLSPDYYIHSNVTAFLHNAVFHYYNIHLKNVHIQRLYHVMLLFLQSDQNPELYNNLLYGIYKTEIDMINNYFELITQIYMNYTTHGPKPGMSPTMTKLFNEVQKQPTANLKRVEFIDMHLNIMDELF